MTRSQNSHVLVELTRMPWWVSVVVAAIVYAGIRWAAPALFGRNVVLAPMANAFAVNAHWIAAIFLLPAPLALVNAAYRRRLVDGQASMERIRALSWQEFEHLVGETYRRNGYRVTELGGAGADGGIDIELRASGKRLVVQCKRWKNRIIGVALVRELFGAMTGEQADGAIFVTSGSFTRDAVDFARDKPIKLVNGHELVEMLRDVKKGQQTDVPSKAAPALAPLITTADGPMTCPRCGNPMVKRVAKQGVAAGQEFWGCSHFPACRGTRNFQLLP